MVTTVKPDGDQSGFVDGVDRHYYENQVGAASPLDDKHAFRIAAARAKDRARHDLIRAVRVEAAKARGDILSDGASARAGEKRSVNGVDGAPDDAIKL